MSDQALAGWFVCGNVRVLAVFVYASCFRRKRLELWDFLRALDAGTCPFFVGDDVNIVRNNDEKVGGLLRPYRPELEFNHCIHDCGLIDIPSDGNKFSWRNGRQGGRHIWAKLDCILVSSSFLNSFGEARMEFLLWTSSDHCPMLLFLKRERRGDIRYFRFQGMWGTHEGFLPLAREVWNQSLEGSPMVKLAKRLKLLKAMLWKWNFETFGRVDLELVKVGNRLVELKDLLAAEFTQEREVDVLACKQQHLQWLKREEMLGRQKSHIRWLKEGDSNSGFFHTSMWVKKKNLLVKHMVLENGSELGSADVVHAEAVWFYQELLSTSAVAFDEKQLCLLTPTVSVQENEMLCAPPTMEDVKIAALWSIP
ncbi:hypothetical protein F2P56_030673 [Juglans regia]|uniref:Uncharacterized protein LOC109003944 n=2 Tax=Juglans regia TaxID=51240 RepID=A0A2I4G1R6_JUGRE|nr:uncharacterized protein LOC109003944 [Juglans regia]KAF5450310.1 hypothetical protein F2P56_030673 [Juglans regia]